MRFIGLFLNVFSEIVFLLVIDAKEDFIQMRVINEFF